MSWAKKFTSVRPAIDPVVIERLRNAKICDLEQLQERFYGDLNSSLRDAGKKLNVQPDVLAALMAKSLVTSAKPLTTSWTRRHWADAVLVLAIVYVVLVLLRPWLSGWIEAPERRVVAARPIPIYGMIRADSLRVTNTAPGQAADRLTSRFVGRYALAAIPAGTALIESQLSRKESDISGQSILQIEIKHAPPLDGRDLPEDVDLLFSARRDAAAGVSLPGRLLALDTTATPPVAAVALSKDKADEAAKWLGSSDIYLSLRER